MTAPVKQINVSWGKTTRGITIESEAILWDGKLNHNESISTKLSAGVITITNAVYTPPSSSIPTGAVGDISMTIQIDKGNSEVFTIKGITVTSADIIITPAKKYGWYLAGAAVSYTEGKKTVTVPKAAYTIGETETLDISKTWDAGYSDGKKENQPDRITQDTDLSQVTVLNAAGDNIGGPYSASAIYDAGWAAARAKFKREGNTVKGPGEVVGTEASYTANYTASTYTKSSMSYTAATHRYTASSYTPSSATPTTKNLYDENGTKLFLQYYYNYQKSEYTKETHSYTPSSYSYTPSSYTASTFKWTYK